MSTHRQVSLPAGERLDVVLAQQLNELVSRSRIQKLIEQGKVTVDGSAVTKPSFKSKTDTIAVISIPKEVPVELKPQPEIKLDILYQDEYLAVIHKPAGMTVHPGISTGNDTLVHALLGHFDKLPTEAGADRPGIVHRLDRDTEGLLLIARTGQSHRRLAELFEKRQIKKTYHALIWGDPGFDRRLEGTIQRNPKERRLMQFLRNTEGGKKAALTFQVLSERTPFTLIQIDLETGRTHQIRATFASLGCPVVGDNLYGNLNHLCRRFKVGKKRREIIETSGMKLIANSLEFKHPFTDKNMKFEIAIPPGF